MHFVEVISSYKELNNLKVKWNYRRVSVLTALSKLDKKHSLLPIVVLCYMITDTLLSSFRKDYNCHTSG